jgi:hypothetical protein
MPRLQATVPPGAPSNALLRVRLPDGAEVKVRVPDGLTEGDEFQFEVNSLGEIQTVNAANSAVGGKSSVKNKNPKKKQRHHVSSNNVDHYRGSNHHHLHGHPNQTPLFISVCLELYQKFIQLLTTTITEEYHDEHITTSSTGSSSRGRHLSNSEQRTCDNNNNNNNNNKLSKKGFLDQDIHNAGDFILALAVGMFLGLSIVVGFLAGVLWVTPSG